MDENDLECLESKDNVEIGNALKRFVEKNNEIFTFPNLNENELRRRLWSALFKILSDSNSSDNYINCLQCIRILSRDITDLNDLVCEEWMNILQQHAGLLSQEEALQRINQSSFNYNVMLEAQKCLCNLIFNSTSARTICSKNHSVEGVVMRLRTYRDPELPHEIKFFDMKMLFLITALCADDSQVDLACEVLKVLFNLTVGKGKFDHTGEMRRIFDEEEEAHFLRLTTVLHDLLLCDAKTPSKRDELRKIFDEEEEAHFLRLTTVLHDLLLCDAKTPAKRDELRNHTINLLVNIPSHCYEELVTIISKDAKDIPKDAEYEGMNMQAVSVLVDFLSDRLKEAQAPRTQQEKLCPILTVLVEAARAHRKLRKFLRIRILPPLTDVLRRPEEGETVRNHLCRLLTTPASDVHKLVSDFLFVLCKESVSRMVKYTGYGNAAGLLAHRGLMLGGKGSSGNYSSDSEDSDTEEYKKYRDHINPVTGCFEPPRPNPTEGMSDEQKEFEAMQLVNMMDKLTRY
ncbi:hypothetical protein J437_LFUL009819 [Ladona fulva]|uniref:Synembryn-A n=1 Tax=Ladona fulva TaxID=123851 RepID=A0A8K0KAU8_LADFU|nr:hypothetical protein J437_LFUL009819 [Ladona fulva]